MKVKAIIEMVVGTFSKKGRASPYMGSAMNKIAEYEKSNGKASKGRWQGVLWSSSTQGIAHMMDLLSWPMQEWVTGLQCDIHVLTSGFSAPPSRCPHLTGPVKTFSSLI